MYLFIDEAGRGPVIGPMVIAGVILEKDVKGAKDSKELTPKKREELFNKIINEAKEVKYIIIDAKKIDQLRKTISLNEIEAYFIAKLITKFDQNFEKVFVDSPDVIQERFGKTINKYLKNKVEIISEHKADQKYNGVSCASIIAKVIRDKEIKKLEEENGITIGTGYPHDEITINLLRNYFKSGKRPDFIRYSWITTKRLLEESENKQKSLFEY